MLLLKSKIRLLLLLVSLLILIVLPGKTLSQTIQGEEVKGYTKGYLIKKGSGDTIRAYIKNSFEHSNHNYILCIMGDGSEYKCTANEYLYFKRDTNEFKAVNITSKGGEAKYVFMILLIENHLSLYKNITIHRNNNKTLQKVDYYLSRANDKTIKVKSHNISRKLTPYFIDFAELAKKILNNEYDINTIDEIVKEYNTWIDNGKPISPESEKLQKEIEDSYKIKFDKSFGIEFSAMVNYTMIHVPRDMNKIITFKANGYGGYDIKWGFKFRVISNYFFRMGVQNWTKNTRFYYEVAVLSDYNDTVDFFGVEEKGNLTYMGLYLLNDFEFKNGFISFGVNVSLNYNYKNKYTKIASDYNWLLPMLKNKSLMTDSFNNQVDFEISGGYKYKFNSQLAIKPVLTFVVPIVPLYFSGVFGIYEDSYGDKTYRDLNIYAFQIKAGLIIDIGLSN